jgi:outer membrane protein assembly factor BamB
MDPNTYLLKWMGQQTPSDPIKPVIAKGVGLAFIENDHAFDGKTVYVTAHNHPMNFTMKCTDKAPGCVAPGGSGPDLPNLPHNATTSAFDAATGNVLWSRTFDQTTYRGGTMTSGGVVYLTAVDGNIYMLNAQNGQTISKMYIGSPMDVGPTIGATSDGTELLYVNIGAGTAPGALIALGLPAGGGPTSVSTSISMVTVTGGGSTVTVSGSTQTSVVTSTVSAAGAAGGIDPTTFYAVAAVAAIAIIAALGLAITRRRRTPG